MQIKDRFVVDASPEVVWAFLHNISRVSRCLPGAEDVREVAPNVYRGRLQASAGAVKANFDGEVVVTEEVPPQRLVASIQAQDRKLASTITATFHSTLTPDDGGTRLEYEIDVSVRGRLAQIGFGSVRQVMRKMTGAFAACLQEALATSAPATPADGS